ncbi:MAG: hypothetical protein IT583_04210 [Verrucomicrobia bacterium]|nr:hypothetical protein [Verrucomicrobiota bacterium]
MKKLIYLVSMTAALSAFSTPLASRTNEWNFYSDPVGKTLSEAYNSVGDSTFSVGGAGFLLTDGKGNLICTNNDSGSTGMWTSGAVLTAPFPIATTGVHYLRFDFSYDLSSTNNDSGTVLGFAFKDSTSNKVAGIGLQVYLPSAPSATNLTVTTMKTALDTTGTVSVIAKVNLSNAPPTMDVWYDLTGTGNFNEANPAVSNVTLNISSIDQLQFQATGDFTPVGSTNFAKVSLMRTSGAWAGITAAEPSVGAATYLNEWTFERDLSGKPLSEAINSGTSSPLAQFSSGSGSTVYTTNRALLCVGDNTATNGVWSNGAILNAALTSSTSGVQYLRYDLAYSLTNALNNSGTLMGVYFTGDSDNQAAGLVLGYEQGGLAKEIPTNRLLTAVTNQLALSGTLTAIAEVNLDSNTLKVWYDLTGSKTFNSNAPDLTTSIALNAIENLRFHATGDFRPAGSADYATIDNIRQTASWSDVTNAVVDLSKPAVLSVTVSNSMNGAMDINQTNTVSVVIRNDPSAGAAYTVNSMLTHDGVGSAFTIISKNTAVAVLNAGQSVTNTYQVIALLGGKYTLSATALSEKTNSAPQTFSLAVGRNLGFLVPPVISEISGGVVSGRYEPGETLNITITTTNDGALVVSNIFNSLSTSASGFTVTALGSTNYSSLAPGATASTIYQVVIPVAATGTNYFVMADQSGSMTWTNSFALPIFSSSIPSVSSTSVTIRVASGETNTATVTLSNTGNIGVGYTVSDDNRRPVGMYTVTTQGTDQVSFLPAQFEPNTVYTNGSAPKSIGFDMPVFGTFYSSFTISPYGSVTLIATNGQTALLKVFQTASAAGTNSIRISTNIADRLVIAWKNGTDDEFQAWLNKDGSVRYLYSYGITGTGTISIQNSEHTQTISHTPGLVRRDSVLLTPQNWITYAPASGSVNAQTNQTLVFTANAVGQPNGTSNTFNTTVSWTDGSTDVIEVTVIVETLAPNLVFVSPVPFTFSGAAGIIAHADMIISNSGNAALNYIITDSGLQTNKYAVTNVAYGLYGISRDHALSPAQLGAQALNIGFPFVYFGNVYTSLIVNANGTLTLGSGVTISPFGANLSLDGDASVKFFADPSFSRFFVIWENMAQASGGSNQTFQAALYRDGSIQFNYKNLETGWTNGTIQLTDTSGVVTGTLVNASTMSISNNLIYQTNTTYITNGSQVIPVGSVVVVTGTNTVTNYTATANYQSLKFTPGQLRIISALPVTGIVPAGKAATIQLSGDARSLRETGPYNVTNSTTLSFGYSGTSTNALVNFVATNSADAAFGALDPLAQADMWGADPVVNSQQGTDGSRTLSWAAANDDLNRTYRVWFSTTSPGGPWIMMDPSVENGTSFVDDVHKDVPKIFYKVTVE